MKKYIIPFFIGCVSYMNVVAQSFDESLNLSRINPKGTAAYLSTGGAATALGADFTLLSINPAGLGEYKSNMFIFTPSFRTNNTRAFLTNAPGAVDYQERKSGIGIENIGFVISTQPRNVKWSNVNIGVGINQINQFSSGTYFEGLSQGTILDRWTGLAAGLEPESLNSTEAILAYNVGAIYDYDPQTGTYLTDFDFYEGPIRKSQEVQYRGRNNEIVIGVAGNYNQKINVGMSVGIPIYRYEENSTYRESDPNLSGTTGGDINFFNSLAYTENLTTSGYGLNIKGGLIYKITPFTRIGISASTPTWYRLSDTYNTTVVYDYTDSQGNSRTNETVSGNFDYRYSSPWTANIGFGHIFRSGFISVALDYMDFRNGRYNFTAFSNNPVDRLNEQVVNSDINSQLASSLSASLGGEYNFNPVRIRGGVRLIQSPYANDDSIRPVYSGGIGFRSGNFILDFGYSFTQFSNTVIPYRVEGAPQPVGNATLNRGIFAVTVAFRG